MNHATLTVTQWNTLRDIAALRLGTGGFFRRPKGRHLSTMAALIAAGFVEEAEAGGSYILYRLTKTGRDAAGRM